MGRLDYIGLDGGVVEKTASSLDLDHEVAEGSDQVAVVDRKAVYPSYPFLIVKKLMLVKSVTTC